jgi:hypothetical protein
LRARDADRDAVCRVLDTALADGQLTGEEHRQRVAAATSAATLGDLDDLTTDLQAAGEPPPAARPNRRLLIVAASGCGAIAVVAAVVMAVTGGDEPAAVSGPSAHPIAESSVAPTELDVPDGIQPSVVTMPTEFHTLAGMTALLDTIRQRFGGTTGIELAVWSDQAMLLLPDPSDDEAKLLYRFRNGWGDASSRSRDPEDVPADLGAFDVAAAVEALRASPETVGIAPGDVSDVVIDIDWLHDPAGPGALELMIKVSSTSGADGFVFLDSAGAIKTVERAS